MNPEKRLGYFVTKDDGSLDFKIHEQILSCDTLDEFHKITNVVLELQPIFFGYEIARRNLGELTAYTDETKSHSTVFGKSGVIPMLQLIDYKIDSCKLINSYLSSTNSRLEHVQKYLKREFGDKSEQYVAWDQLRKDLHHRNFSYRFLYQLRHFSQHYSLPFTGFKVSGSRDSTEDTIDFVFAINIQRDKIIESGFDWARLEEKIKKQPPEFDLLPLCRDFFEQLSLLFVKAIECKKSEIGICINYFKAIWKILDPPKNAVVAIFSGELDPNSLSSTQFEIVPTAELEWQLNQYFSAQKLLHENL